MPLQPVNPATKNYLKALVFAGHGRGKTYFLGTAQQDERTRPMAFLDFEGNTETLAGLDIDVYPIRTWSDYGEAYNILRVNKQGYKSIGLDSITETNLWALFEVMHQDRDGDKRDKGPFGEPDQAFIQDYGKILTQLRRLLRRFRDLPLHVFYTALIETEDVDGEGTVRQAKMLGQMTNEVGALMGAVVAIVKEERRDPITKKKLPPVRVMLLHDIAGYDVKIRTPFNVPITSVPNAIDNPTVTKLLDALIPAAQLKAKE